MYIPILLPRYLERWKRSKGIEVWAFITYHTLKSYEAFCNQFRIHSIVSESNVLVQSLCTLYPCKYQFYPFNYANEASVAMLNTQEESSKGNKSIWGWWLQFLVNLPHCFILQCGGAELQRNWNVEERRYSSSRIRNWVRKAGRDGGQETL